MTLLDLEQPLPAVEEEDDDAPAPRLTTAGASDDPVKDYLRLIARVRLLTAEQEVDLAKRIEAGLYAERLLTAETAYDTRELAPGPRRLPGSPRPGPVDHAGGPRKQMNTAPVDHGVLYAARSTKVPCSFLHHPLPSFPSLRRPAWRPSARMPRETKSAAWLPSSSRSPILAGRAGCATGSPRCWPWWSVR
ncbi:sigma-70 factor domain-containing protein [Streptomyces acidiscabies]|uniref:sigma-70 factor domain-containing protein n=1 Tax=Streptomyces acidiscabies TaxID=42234 RepID=UPI003BAF14F9